MQNINDVRKKVAALQKMNASYVKQIKSLISDMDVSSSIPFISYFTYSLNISHEPERENFCIGSFHIHNLGNKPLVNPYICIKIDSESPFDFSGKYFYKDSKQKVRLNQAWERFNDPKDKHEFWLKPNEKHTLEPSETLTFSNFQVKWIPNSSYIGRINGFLYGDKINEGINALNQISINGNMKAGGDGDE
ncbi:hypothetical protein ACFSTA_20605 [Ornithinibacillus salinisoli]|uniref:Uncharacterized protein n=1 Tax=Ornithinibacillus salinisoli TaxID=1848459 RepID=A0ABW4W759_9BACI